MSTRPHLAIIRAEHAVSPAVPPVGSVADPMKATDRLQPVGGILARVAPTSTGAHLESGAPTAAAHPGATTLPPGGGQERQTVQTRRSARLATHAPTVLRPTVGATSTRPAYHRPTAGPVGSCPLGGAA